MRLKLDDIGIIKKADINLNGLTVIAGKNDSGKSTISKILYSIITTIEQAKLQTNNLNHIDYNQYKSKLNHTIDKIFNSQISENGNITLEYKKATIKVKFTHNYCDEFNISNKRILNEASALGEFKILMIETPYIWNIFSTIKSINNISRSQIDFDIPTILNDLYLALNTKLKENNIKIKLDINSIINGEFTEDSLGNFIFEKETQKIELINTAMGIKYFGILQVLSNNHHFYKNQIVILDEPEVHLHPTWQLELAKIIVNLVSKGMKIIVNSHSPYMIEALQRYAKKINIIADFYLAQDGMICEDNQALSKIFATLSEPFEEFDKMDSENLNG
jgi:predicted ATPase